MGTATETTTTGNATMESPADNGNTSAGAENHLLSGKKLWIAFTSMLLALFLIALDQTILSTALPRIASDFNAFSLQGWIAASFVLTQTAFILFFAQVLRILPAKYVLLAAIFLFEVGSALSGAAPDVYSVIGGRALSGVGAAGIVTGILQVIAQATRLEDRPLLFSLFESVYAIASVVGPLMGGAFTDHVTWRWCFYINLPVGGVSMLCIVLLVDAPPPLGSENYDGSAKTILRQSAALDWVGAAISLGAVTSLCLGLQWGGNEKPWDSPAVIVCLVVAPVLAVALVYWERYKGDEAAMVPLAIFKKGISVYSLCIFGIFNRFFYLIFIYYIPIYYQAVRNHSATQSGLDLLPLMVSIVVSIVAPAWLVVRYGRYWPYLISGPVFGAVGAGMMFTLTASTPNAAVIGYQILLGICVGTALQNLLLAMQAEFDDTPKLISQATGMINFCQFLGGTIGVTIAEAVFSSQLSQNLHEYAPEAPVEVVEQSPLSIYTALPEWMIPSVVDGYVESLTAVYLIGVPAAIISLLVGLFISNLNIKQKPEPEVTDDIPSSNSPASNNALNTNEK